jgi:hypothetical protein
MSPYCRRSSHSGSVNQYDLPCHRSWGREGYGGAGCEVLLRGVCSMVGVGKAWDWGWGVGEGNSVDGQGDGRVDWRCGDKGRGG